eukprot:TRINITY_DN8613_c0_g1_i2.p1 TRINITY_DN8613_c0_g1~~TRINITY_DN8613_c0_g1_i2.p1  ORF type:complete len:149 (-),score=9.84 TRINITY_DN8613_c0_g1_i2:187-633(-)
MGCAQIVVLLLISSLRSVISEDISATTSILTPQQNPSESSSAEGKAELQKLIRIKVIEDPSSNQPATSNPSNSSQVLSPSEMALAASRRMTVQRERRRSRAGKYSQISPSTPAIVGTAPNSANPNSTATTISDAASQTLSKLKVIIND